MRYDFRILNALLDSYENSVLFRGENKTAVHISFPFTKRTMPEYFNESSLDFDEIHGVVKELEQKGFLVIVWKRGKENHIIQKAVLNEKNVECVYAWVKRTPKAKNVEETWKLLTQWKAEKGTVVESFILYLQERMEQGKSVKEFIDLSDRDRTKLILTALDAIEKNRESCYIREFSIRHFGDSKVLESIAGLLTKILRRFIPAYEEMDKDAILAEYAVYHTPNYVYIKGEGELIFPDERRLELSCLRQGMGLSGDDILNIEICGNGRIRKVITIENLTTFFRWEEEHSLIIYLGGYHNLARRQLLQRIYEAVPEASYVHFGDIDAGGFEIYRDLCRKTGIAFQRYHMGIEELERYKECAKELTDNDRKRIRNLIEKERASDSEMVEVLEYMEKYGIKLEQEAVH